LSVERGHRSRGGILSGAYGRITTLRRRWYARPGTRRKLERRVISVGNLSMGGSGKTPVVAAIARLLRARGERPAILTRGYGRRDATEGVLIVSDGERVLEPVSRSGDEPQMLARALPGVPVLVCADRYMAGRFAEQQFDTTVSILDDGFQHVQLERDVDLLLVSDTDLQDSVVPSGHLREPLAAARLADAVLIDGTDEQCAEVISALAPSTMFRIRRHYGEVNGAFPGNRVFAFAGIARPQRFFDALRAQGYDVAGELSFPDHHWYTPRDVAAIRAAAADAHASALVTTEKDAVRCDLGAAVLPMRVEIEPAGDFAVWLMGRLGAHA